MSYAKALYSNEAECADELNFNEGDLLKIIDKNAEDSEGWWKCKLNGNEGLVPANYLQEIFDPLPEQGNT